MAKEADRSIVRPTLFEHANSSLPNNGPVPARPVNGCPSYGIYGPAFELVENAAREPGSEEYLDSEKYQIRHWDLGNPESLAEFVRRVNSHGFRDSVNLTLPPLAITFLKARRSLA